MQALVDDRRIPNLVTLVARQGQIVHDHACGVLDLDDAAPADTLFRMYSPDPSDVRQHDAEKHLLGGFPATKGVLDTGVLDTRESVLHVAVPEGAG
ncbi:MAG: serine hydrolase, partial [Bryobacterales bacterium]|nr:serine hydrolase [Bryobacterales bacterium]